jgi:hypothetical protein
MDNESSTHVAARNAFKILDKLSEKRPLDWPGHRLKDNVKIDLKKQNIMVWTEFI